MAEISYYILERYRRGMMMNSNNKTKTNSLKSRSKSAPINAVIGLLSVLIIAESIWLVDKLQRQTVDRVQKTDVPASPTSSSSVQLPRVAILLQGPDKVAVGEEFEIEVFLQGLQNISIESLDVYLNYNPEFIQIIDQDQTAPGIQVEISPDNPFTTVGRNFAEPENKRIILTYLMLEANQKVVLQNQEKIILAKIHAKGLAAGNTQLSANINEGELKRTKLIDSRTKQEIMLTKSDFFVTIK